MSVCKIYHYSKADGCRPELVYVTQGSNFITMHTATDVNPG